MSTYNLLIGGKLGDFLLGVYGAHLHCRAKKLKVNIYMVDIGWDFGLKQTYDALYPILINQEFVNNFQILTNYKLDPIQTPHQNSPIQVFDQKLIEEGYLVDDYINSPLIYKACWSDLYANMYKTQPTINTAWLSFDKKDHQLANTVIIHRKSIEEKRFNPEFPYEQIIDSYESVIFASTNKKDYDAFPWKQSVDFLQIESLDHWFTVISSCSMYVGNLTAPVVIAHALDKMRIIELPFNADSAHWIGEEKYSTNIKWFLNNNNHNLTS